MEAEKNLNVNSNAKVYQIVIQKYTTFEAAKVQKAGYTS